MKRTTRLREGFPLTLAGTALLALATGAFWFQGVRRLDLVLLSGSVLAALLLVLLLLATVVTALVLHHRARPVQGRILLECGAWTATGFRVPLGRWLPFLAVRVVWASPGEARAEIDLASGQERVLPGRRAAADTVVRIVRVGDILGLTSVGWPVNAPSPVRILPRRASLDPASVIAGLVPGEDESDHRGDPRGDRVDIRKYGHGDPMRMILWKVYARTRRAFVRIPERAVEPAPRICAYLPANPWDEPAARLGRTLLEEGLLGTGWRFGADGAPDAQTLPEALEALALSGSAEGPTGLRPFMDRARRDGFGVCILLLPGREGPWTEGIQAALADAPLRIHVVFALEGWAPRGPGRWGRFVVQPPPAEGAVPDELLGLHGKLVPAGMDSTLVDTVTGDVLERPEAFLRKRAGRAA